MKILKNRKVYFDGNRFLSIIFLIVIAFSCGQPNEKRDPNKEEPEKPGIEDPEKPGNNLLLYEKTELGGCNVKVKSELKNSDEEGDAKESEEDIFNITITEESVQFSVGLNYLCKEEAFETKIEMADDVFFMYIIDTGSGYYRCDCYYTFEFIFKRASVEFT